VLAVDRLEVAYGDLQVLWGVSLEVGAGEMVCLLGPNGSGKSTLMNSVSGLLRPRAGSIYFAGERLDVLPAHRRVERGVAHVLERRRLFPYMTVEENLLLGAYTVREASRLPGMLEEIYTRFPMISEKRRVLAGVLSGGEQQLLAIARGLMSRPRCLMVDEPLLGLALRTQEAVMELLREINAGGVSILFIEQNVRRALQHAHRGYVLRTGRVVLQGRGEDLLANPELERVYLGSASRS
jgi:branched-chain amino acid transport system ATP-binding protein